MLNDSFKRRFTELQASSGQMPRQSGRGFPDFVPDGAWRQWATSAQHLIQAVFGEESAHYVTFAAQHEKCRGTVSEMEGLKGIFLSAKDDFEGGYIFNVDLRVSGEVFGDFVLLARQSLSDGHKDVAAVLASAALEDALKRYAVANGLDVGGKTMQDVVNALKSARLLAGSQKSLIDPMPKLRNAALHAEWDKISQADVGGMIGFVEQFLLVNFSG